MYEFDLSEDGVPGLPTFDVSSAINHLPTVNRDTGVPTVHKVNNINTESIPILGTRNPKGSVSTITSHRGRNKGANSNKWPHNIAYTTHYPKGIPRSFLLPQETMNMGLPPGQQITDISNNPINLPQTTNTDFRKESLDSHDDDSEDEDDSSVFGRKRQSAFERLGPITKPKKPKLIINLLCSKDQAVREVVDEEILKAEEAKEDLTPVYMRKDVLSSIEEVVLKYLPAWPWKFGVTAKRTVMPKESKSAMLMEQEQIAEGYENNNAFIKVEVKECPINLNKEFILDLLLDKVRDNIFIPCFIERNENSLYFLVIKNRDGLLDLHKVGLKLQYDNTYMPIHISLTSLNTTSLNFLPKLILKDKLIDCFDGQSSLDLKAFCQSSDIKHFLYFPLSRELNQTELIQLHALDWSSLVHLDLSHNNLTSIDGFELGKTTPKLKNLDLSHNQIERMTSLLSSRGLHLHSLVMEGNPLCINYTDPNLYIKAARMIFPGLQKLDGIQISRHEVMTEIKQTYCPPDAISVVEKFLETFFPLLDSPPDDRLRMDELYSNEAVLTVTLRYRLHSSVAYRHFRELFTRSRCLEDSNLDAVQGASAISKCLARWPPLCHDPTTFHVDVLHHDDFTTILRVMGIVKIPSVSLAQDEQILAFTRTLVLHSDCNNHYKIHNEMLYWDIPTEEYSQTAFQLATMVPGKRLHLKFDPNPSRDLKDKIISIFMNLTEQTKMASERCLSTKNWDLRAALEDFMKHVKFDSTEALGELK